jgi:nicotinamide mononucleotide transporter
MIPEDFITVAMWVIAGDWIMTTMWAVYLLNACYGFYIWTKMNKADNVVNE